MALGVIGTGFGRTGTDSMREALNILGFGPCHHMYEVRSNPVQAERWMALARGAAPEWESLFEGYNSCVDWPSAAYWRELVQVYPQAKVILTWRPAADWWTSFESSILAYWRASADEPPKAGRLIVEQGVLQGRAGDRDHAIALYEANVAAVQATVPARRLLIHQPQDGWPPLCAHLGVPVPGQPYPRRNSGEAFRQAIARG
jgi:hypothetical protein